MVCCLPQKSLRGILQQKVQQTTAECNCRDKPNCPLPSNGECRLSGVVYKATVSSDEGEKEYIGVSETEIKQRISNHKSSFRYENKRNSTRLSQYVWKLKDEDKQYNIRWEIMTKTKCYQPGKRNCDLCLSEKWRILTSDPSKTLNKRTEMASKCRHKAKFKIGNIK